MRCKGCTCTKSKPAKLVTTTKYSSRMKSPTKKEDDTFDKEELLSYTDAKEVLTKYRPAYCIPGTPIWIMNQRPLLPHPSEVITEYWDGSIKEDIHYQRNRAMKGALKRMKEEERQMIEEQNSSKKKSSYPSGQRHSKKRKVSNVVNK